MSINEVANGQYRVSVNHSWAGEPHDRFYSIPVIFLVAVHGAIFARGFPFLKWTLIEPGHGVVMELFAITAQGDSLEMDALTIDLYHESQGLSLPGDPGLITIHDVALKRTISFKEYARMTCEDIMDTAH